MDLLGKMLILLRGRLCILLRLRCLGLLLRRLCLSWFLGLSKHSSFNLLKAHHLPSTRA